MTTRRLVLRPFTLDDALDVERLAGVREIADTTLNVPHPYPPGAAERWITTHAIAFERGDQVNCAVERLHDGALMGVVSLTLTPAHARAELGYWIGHPYWGHGYATEAARALVGYGFAELELNRVQAHYLTRNPASGRVMQKLGMRREGHLRQYLRKWDVFEDIEIYGVLRENWK